LIRVKLVIIRGSLRCKAGLRRSFVFHECRQHLRLKG
jgi:hypothetical protein